MAANPRRKQGNQVSQPTTESFLHLNIKQAKRSLAEFWQRPVGNLLTLAVISMALAMPACLYLLGKNIAEASQEVTSPAQVSAYLQEGTPDARAIILKDNLEGWDLVAQVEYISPQQGLEELSSYSGFDEAISLLDNDVLPGVLVIDPNVETDAQIKQLAQQLREQSNVTDVRLDEDWLTRLDAIKTLATWTVITLSTLMLGAVFLIVGNTLRFNVLANKHEIQTMKLIGATDSYILRPYLFSGMWFGFLGSAMAWLLTMVITLILNAGVDNLARLYDSHFRLIGLAWDESLLLLMLGTLLGSLAARLSAQRHLKEIEPV
ncbi:cell division protein FtsX [Vibrio sp. 10N.286.49.B3]|uniref:permease-like cell division protein FtsX n=1 Tax=Vibrio sp. 10N.286.49.B3 TaxID=1880855 RepID=UPI000C81A63A|nr:permease-like cell division protein FtsX [Vibrio sp. 10N.286.49.B3]PMH45434.1 cell division protein FtsX [Vibrio sp. 10N.286.49.B3]